MALTESVQLDIREAEREIAALERQLVGLGAPIDVPVNVTGGQELAGIRQELGLSESSVESLNRELDKTDDNLREAGREADRTGSEIEQAGKKGESGFSGLGIAVAAAAAAFIAFRGARAFVDFATDAIGLAANLEESVSKAATVFGVFGDDIADFAAEAPRNLNLTTQAALEATASFGNFFTALGLTQREAAELSPSIVTLAADLASFNNIDISDALNKLQSGLAGQSRPLRELGVNLSAAAVDAKALELGLGDLNGELDEAAKVQARYALIMEQTATAQGDLERTSDSVANRQRALAAQIEETRTAFGVALIPIMEAFLDVAPNVISAIEQGLIPAFEQLGRAAANLDLQPFINFIAGLPAAVETLVGNVQDGAGALAAFGGVIRSVATFDVRGAVDAFGNLGDSIDNIQVRSQVNRSIQTLIDTIGGGLDPLTAFEATLVDLARSGADLPDDVFGDLIDNLAAIAGIDTADASGLLELRAILQAVGEESGFTASQVRTITDALDEVLGISTRIGPNFRRGSAGVEELNESLEDLPPTIDDVRGALAELASTDIDISSEIARLDAQFAKLPDALSAAKDALKDEENEIVEDFGTFLSNLESELERRQAFADDLALLRAMGLENLADTFADIGLDAAAAAADAVANPQEAQRAEDALVGFAESQATAYTNAFAQSISSEPITTELIASIVEAAGNADSPQVQAALAALAQQLAFQIPVGFDIVGTGTVGQSAAQAGGVEPGGPPGGGTTVVQNFEGGPPPTPDLVRAAQAANQIIVS